MAEDAPVRPPTQRKTLQIGTLEKNREDLRRGREMTKVNAIILVKAPLMTRGQQMIENFDLVLDSEQTLETYCASIGTAVENAVYQGCYKAAKLPLEYNNKVRAIGFNLVRNHSLASEVLWERITPARLAEMTTDEMANKELKEYMEKVRIQSEINITLVKSDGPRIRKTHKGEEFVEELRELRQTPTPEENIFPSTTNGADIQTHSKDLQADTNMTGTGNDSLSVPLAPSSRQASRAIMRIGNEESLCLNSSPQARVGHSYNSNESGVALPSSPGRMHLNRDLVEPDSNKISKSVDQPPQVLARATELEWVGRIERSNFASLCTVAQLAGGPEYIAGVKWSALLDEVLHIGNEVSPDVADEYLKHLACSKSSAMVMVCLTPMDRADGQEFTKLFEYFTSVQRYAVIGKHYLRCIRSVHLIFLDKNDCLPSWFALLNPPCKISTFGRMSGILLAVFGVIRDLVEATTLHDGITEMDDAPDVQSISEATAANELTVLQVPSHARTIPGYNSNGSNASSGTSHRQSWLQVGNYKPVSRSGRVANLED